jgi:Fic family protein
MTNIFNKIDCLNQKITSLNLSSQALENIKEYFRIALTYSSNALEGNSLTQSETKIVLEDGLTVGGKPIVDYLEAIGHSDAYNFLYTLMHQKGFIEDDIRYFHKLFYYRIDESNAGIYRKIKVAISGSEYALPSPEEVPTLMQKFVSKFGISDYTEHPVKWAAKTHLEFVFIHPFIDGNGRVARLLMNLVLLQAGHITIIPPILRRDYINALEKAHTDPSDFMHFIAECVLESQKDYVRLFG